MDSTKFVNAMQSMAEECKSVESCEQCPLIKVCDENFKKDPVAWKDIKVPTVWIKVNQQRLKKILDLVDKLTCREQYDHEDGCASCPNFYTCLHSSQECQKILLEYLLKEDE